MFSVNLSEILNIFLYNLSEFVYNFYAEKIAQLKAALIRLF